MDLPPGAKPPNLHSALKDAHLRIDYLCKICTELVLAAEPERRRHLEDLLAVVAAHGPTAVGGE